MRTVIYRTITALALLFWGTTLSTAVRAERVILRLGDSPELSQPARDFANAIYYLLLSQMGEAMDDWSPGRFLVGEIDLDGDGKNELLVQILSAFFCGNNETCPTEIFSKGNFVPWLYVGTTYSGQFVEIVNGEPRSKEYVTVRDETYNGWRVIESATEPAHSGDPETYRGILCWTKFPQLVPVDFWDSGFFGFGPAYSDQGYFNVDPRNKTCEDIEKANIKYLEWLKNNIIERKGPSSKR